MTRAPTYPIHRNRRNSISIRFSVRSIRFSRCGPGPVGPRPPASLALGGKEIHYPPWRARVKGDPPLHRDSTTGGAGRGGGARGRERPAPCEKGRAPRLLAYTIGAAQAGSTGSPPPKRERPRSPGALGQREGAARRRPLWRWEAPCASEAPYPPAAWRCSTFGDGGLNCRVRNGIG